MNDIKKILIITLYGNYNFGNKLQNYALYKILSNYGFNTETLKIKYRSFNIFKRIVREIIEFILSFKICDNREKNFLKFNNNIVYTKKKYSTNSIIQKKFLNYDYGVYGSDQIWNPSSFGNSKLYLGYRTNNNISYAASFGVSEINSCLKNEYKDAFENNFKTISVREDRGKEIVEELTGRKDVQVLVDPTMLLTADEWDKVSKIPENGVPEKYILNYFLGSLSEERKNEINRIAKENNCEIINILDKNDPYYISGPSEFLYLEKHAFLICTDSFHSSVFAILYNRPFVIFDREQKGLENMNSRLDTLINKFKLKNRKYNGTITKENLEHDYSEAYKILEEERIKSDNFLKKALDIKE